MKSRRAAGAIFYVLSFLLSLLVFGMFYAFLNNVVTTIQNWQTQNYPTSSYFNVPIYQLWQTGWVWLPAMMFISLIIGLWLRAHYRRGT